MKSSRKVYRLLATILCITLLVSSSPALLATQSEVAAEHDAKAFLTDGDLSIAELTAKVLPENERPEIISMEAIRENNNVHRLYEQETDLNSVVFQNRDGTKTMYYFEDAVKYKAADSTVRDKSNILYEQISDRRFRDDYALVNADNDINTYFPRLLNDLTGVVVTDGGVTVEMHPLTSGDESAPVAEQRADNYVYYDRVFGEGSALRYTPIYTGVKEDIVLERDIEVYEFSFVVTAQGLTPRIDGNRVVLYDKDGNQAAALSEIFIYDSAEEQNTSFYSKVSVSETENRDEFIYTIHVDREFLQSTETVYPVYIDPTLTINVSGTGTTKTIIDTPVYSGVSTNCQGANIWNIVGFANTASSGYGVGRTLMKFPGLMNNATFQSIGASQVNSLRLFLNEASGKTTSSTIFANLYTGAAWNETNTAYNHVTWNGYGTQLSSQTFSTSNVWITFDLTSAVSTWKANSTTADKGIMLRNSNETSDSGRKDFRSTENSTNKPYLVLDYTTVIPVTSVSVSPTSVSLKANNTQSLTATVLPSNATNRSVTWSSNNTTVATVSTTGVVTGRAAGIAVITATAADGSGKSGTSTVNVYQTTFQTTVSSRTVTFSSEISSTPTWPDRTNAKNESARLFDKWPAYSESRYFDLPTSYRGDRILDIWIAAYATRIGGWATGNVNASAYLQRFLDKNGNTYTQNFKAMCDSWPTANTIKTNELNATLAASEALARSGQSVVFYTTSEIDHLVNESTDWGRAIGSYTTKIKCTVSVTGTNTYDATIVYSLHDFYDWDRTLTSMGNLPVSPRDMWELHHGGLGKNYEIVGTNTVRITWTKGQRLGAGASKISDQ
jgi:hypothetical protein